MRHNMPWRKQKWRAGHKRSLFHTNQSGEPSLSATADHLHWIGCTCRHAFKSCLALFCTNQGCQLTPGSCAAGHEHTHVPAPARPRQSGAVVPGHVPARHRASGERHGGGLPAPGLDVAELVARDEQAAGPGREQPSSLWLVSSTGRACASGAPASASTPPHSAACKEVTILILKKSSKKEKDSSCGRALAAAPAAWVHRTGPASWGGGTRHARPAGQALCTQQRRARAWLFRPGAPSSSGGCT